MQAPAKKVALFVLVLFLFAAWPVAFVAAQYSDNQQSPFAPQGQYVQVQIQPQVLEKIERYQTYYIGDLVVGDLDTTANTIKAFLSKVCCPGAGDIQAYHPNQSLVIKADEKTHELIAELLQLIRSTHHGKEQKEVPVVKVPQRTIKIVPLTNSPVMAIHNTILQVLPELSTADGSTRIAADPHSNSIVIVSTNPEAGQIVEALVAQLDKPAKAPNKEQNKDIDVAIGQSLHKKVELAAKWYEIVKARYESGAQGGTAQAFHEAKAKFERAQGEALLWMYKQSDIQEVKAELKNRIQQVFADELAALEAWADTAKTANEAGAGDIEVVITTLIKLENAKIRQLQSNDK